MADGTDQDLLSGLQELLAEGGGPGAGDGSGGTGSSGGSGGPSAEEAASATPEFREQLIHCENLVNRMGD